MSGRRLKNPPSTVPPKPRLELIRPTYFFTPDLEREIKALEGVAGVRVLSTGTAIEEIHIVAPGTRKPKKIVRDVETLLLVRYGVRIDHRCISIVHTGQVQSHAPSLARPLIQEVARVGDRVKVTVRVAETLIIGEALVPPDGSELEGAAQALIQAIAVMLNTPGELALLHLQLVETYEQQIVLVLVRWLFPGQQELLVGAGLVHDDPLATAARATLDALNRRLVRFQQAKTEQAQE